jgi:hypothetical protein
MAPRPLAQLAAALLLLLASAALVTTADAADAAAEGAPPRTRRRRLPRPRGAAPATRSLHLPPRRRSQPTCQFACKLPPMFPHLSFTHPRLCRPHAGAALLAFKAAVVDDPHGALADWRADTPPCSGGDGGLPWTGVVCGAGGGVEELELDGLALSGALAPELAALPSLLRLCVPAAPPPPSPPPSVDELAHQRAHLPVCSC